MQLAYPLPWWLAVLLAAAVAGLTFLEYRRPLAPITPARRALLAGCRALVLTALILFLFRPIVLLPLHTEGAVVPILVDASRSMRLDAGDGQTRLTQATAILQGQLLPALSGAFVPQLYSVGDRLEPTTLDRIGAAGRRSDLGSALAAIRDRARGQTVAGIVLLSDGGDTGGHLADQEIAAGPPVFTIGVGSADRIRDREVVAIVAGDQRLDQASVDLRVSVVSAGFGRAPFQLRLLANGRELENRRVVPPADQTPVDEVFTVSPDPAAPTVYRAEIPVGDAEPIPENNSRGVLVNPAGRRRRLLVVAGAPGFEYSFMQRALARDPGLEVDGVVRKGRNADGQDTFVVQAATARTPALTRGFPSRREDLFAYDGLVVVNASGDFFTREQLAMAADFVGERGGGLLVVGGQSFAARGWSGTPLESVLPLELTDRRAMGRLTASAAERNKVVITPEGESHPAMRIGSTPEETRRLWSALPPLAAIAPLGGARPGATILAAASGSTGERYPVIAVQQYGRGRSMIFSGEASWRWRMMLPSADRSHEFVWRQAARWITGSSADPFTISVPDHADAGEAAVVRIEVRDAAFAPVGDAAVDVRATGPDGETSPLKVRRATNEPGTFTADVPVDQDGLYRVSADARRGTVGLGSATRWMYVGGVDREFVDPRLNEPLLRRVARASGGRYVRAADAGQIAGWMRQATPEQGAPERRDLWHEPWAFALVVAALSAEWVARRVWGLR